ncbi:hypothetical protein [Sphingomonas sp.]
MAGAIYALFLLLPLVLTGFPVDARLPAAALERLRRVVSFMGMGVTLMGLSCFYTRYPKGAVKR